MDFKKLSAELRPCDLLRVLYIGVCVVVEVLQCLRIGRVLSKNVYGHASGQDGRRIGAHWASRTRDRIHRLCIAAINSVVGEGGVVIEEAILVEYVPLEIGPDIALEFTNTCAGVAVVLPMVKSLIQVRPIHTDTAKAIRIHQGRNARG